MTALFDAISRGRPLLITSRQILFDATSGGRPLLITSQFSSMRQVWGLPCLLHRNFHQCDKWGETPAHRVAILIDAASGRRPLLVVSQPFSTWQVGEAPACHIETCTIAVVRNN